MYIVPHRLCSTISCNYYYIMYIILYPVYTYHVILQSSLFPIPIRKVYCCCRRKQIRDMKKIAELKRAYEKSGGSHSDSGSDTVKDYVISDAYKYPQLTFSSAFQTDKTTSDTSTIQVSFNCRSVGHYNI